MLPNEPFMLLSYLNMKLRDEYDSLSSLCDDLEADRSEIEEKLLAIGYGYDERANAFRRR
ncbi:MAG: DUF4250 domain-containing protein [Clostridia bacterium]|nr:DUF4250 domain-containing protein [Clostridia bacterium]